MKSQSRTPAIIGIIALLALIMAPRFLDLGVFMTADEKRWLANTRNFTLHLAHQEWGNLLQQPHPGITTQWFGAPTIFTNNLAQQKLPLVIAQSFLILAIGYVFGRLWGNRFGGLVIVLLALNPLLVAHGRVYAMDAFLALFTLLSVGCLLLYQRSLQSHYLWFAAAAAACAILSKLPGLVLIPFTFLFLWWHTPAPDFYRSLSKQVAWWLGVFVVTAILILPALAQNTHNVFQEFLGFFQSDDYQELHGAGYSYYLRSLVFFSTPLQLVCLAVLPVAAVRIFRHRTAGFLPHQALLQEIAWLGLFALMFLAVMTAGQKKGDRYILPVFLVLDAVIVALLAALPVIWHNKKILRFVWTLVAVGIIWQAVDIARLHPYVLAYVNPLTKSFFGERRLGWGEGLDIAAQYLNTKPDAKNLQVATVYPTEFSYAFLGTAIPLHRHEEEQNDYAVLYRAMYERGPEAWETDVLNQYKDKPAEKVISLNGLPYVWIYNLQD